MRIVRANNQSEQVIKQAYNIFCENRDSPWQFETFNNAIKQANSSLAISERRVIAFVLVSTILDEAEVEDVSVSKAHQNKGIATQLLRHSLTALSVSGIVKVFLEVASDNAAGLALYKKIGFENLAVRKKYYQRQDGSVVDAIVMQKLL